MNLIIDISILPSPFLKLNKNIFLRLLKGQVYLHWLVVTWVVAIKKQVVWNDCLKQSDGRRKAPCAPFGAPFSVRGQGSARPVHPVSSIPKVWPDQSLQWNGVSSSQNPGMVRTCVQSPVNTCDVFSVRPAGGSGATLVVPNPGSSDTSHLHHATEVQPPQNQSCIPAVHWWRSGCPICPEPQVPP